MATAAQMKNNLDTIAQTLPKDPGLVANVSNADLRGGQAAARQMDDVLVQAIIATGANTDGEISAADMAKISRYVRQDDALYQTFLEGHGDDDGNDETGFHLVQGDGGTLKFQGRAFVNTVADAIYHYGFKIVKGRFQNEDGNANETAEDVAGWLNYFLNGENIVWGSGKSETLYSGDYSDVLADAKNEVFKAGGGNDKVWAGDGNDVVYAGSGHDTSGGGDGDDTLKGEGGNDKLWGNAGDDSLYGGSGRDTLGGSEGDDMLDGGKGHDKLWGNTGDDEIYGGAGKDVLGGDEGADTLDGGTGRDKLYGGAGDDDMAGGDGRDELWGSDGNDMMSGGDGHDTLGGGDGADTINGDDGADLIYGGTGGDIIDAGAGNDKAYGGDGDDDISGGAGRDTLSGGAGEDIINGGAGRDLLKGWEGAAARDTFVFAQGDTGITAKTRDTIEGFQSGTDLIDLSAFGGLGFISDAGFAGAGTGQLRYDGKIVQIDADGNGAADHSIAISWVNALQADDFIL